MCNSKWLFSILIVAATFSIPAHAFDAVSFAQYQVLKCVHPTADANKASAEIDKPGVMDGDAIKTRVKVFFQGWMRKNQMSLDVYYKAGKPPLTKVMVLEDSSTMGGKTCKYVGSWQELED